MKKALWASVVLAIVSFAMWSKDPLNDVAIFIIAGTIPGTNFSFGFWSTLALAGILLWAVYRALKRQQQLMIEQHTKYNKIERAKKEFEQSHSIEFDRSQRSVIAARTETSI